MYSVFVRTAENGRYNPYSNVETVAPLQKVATHFKV